MSELFPCVGGPYDGRQVKNRGDEWFTGRYPTPPDVDKSQFMPESPELETWRYVLHGGIYIGTKLA